MKTLKRALALWLVLGMLLAMFGEAEDSRPFAEAPREAQAAEVLPEPEGATDDESPSAAQEEPEGTPEEEPPAGEADALSDAGFLMDGDVLVVYEGEGGDVIVPDDVRIIGPVAFGELPELRSVALPASVERIESHAFANCENLEEVLLGEGLTEIGEGAFEGCAKLKEIALRTA